ncbi:hypothetical protein CDL15_Pgr005531 [Punica granatum]|uniref:NB-ARC domain-containing protein n=1 Tax=Punica granatum TaxID=22663 RepID=A0A218WUM9_PUNGR|nr:hypothetical protein CDL15_Pgr005531 [Punica granatum]
MLCQAEVGVRPLSDEEASALFVQTLGSDPPPSRKLVAEDIVKECKGLLLAIVVMAGSIRGEEAEVYNEGRRLLDELEKACLLEANSEGPREVRMHDVIRDMALHIMNANNSPCMVKCGLGLEYVPDDEEWLPNLQKVSLMRKDIKGLKVIDLRSTSITKVLLIISYPVPSEVDIVKEVGAHEVYKY